MESLPQELIQEIVSYLPVEDVLSCNLVCRYFRNCLNHNRLWLNLCSKRFLINKNGPVLLDFTLSHTSPPFAYSGKKNVCEWRLRYMQENWISNNWKLGKYIAEELAQNVVGLDFSDIICDENNLILHFQNEECFKVWDLKNPVSEEESIFWSLDFSSPDYCELVEGVFIYVQADLLHVYTKVDHSFTLKYLFCITKNKDALENMSSMQNLASLYASQYVYLPVFESFCHNRKYFAAAVCETNVIDLYIWDIENGTCRSEKLEIDFEITKIYMKMLSEFKLYIEIRGFREELIKKLYVYDFDSKNFEQIQSQSPIHQALITNLNIICIDESANVSFLDKNDCSLGKTLKLNEEFYEFCGHLMEESHPYFVFTKQDSDTSIVQIYHTEFAQLAAEFRVDDDVISIQFLTSSLLLISCTNYTTIRSEVWDIRNLKKLHTYAFGYFTYASSTKIITFGSTHNKLLILHFW